MLSFRLSRRRAVGHGVHLSLLATGDTLFRSLCHGVVRKCDQTKPYGPPSFRAPSVAMVAYLDHKRAAIQASYFRQRYGRDYWTGLPIAASDARLREMLNEAEYEATASSRREFACAD